MPQDGILAAYAILALATFWSYRGFVAQTDLVLLAMGVVGFGISVFLDALEPFGYRGVGYLLEDGFKFFGIIAWSLSLGDAAMRTFVGHAGQER